MISAASPRSDFFGTGRFGSFFVVFLGTAYSTVISPVMPAQS